jgi:hypothetical protein
MTKFHKFVAVAALLASPTIAHAQQVGVVPPPTAPQAPRAQGPFVNPQEGPDARETRDRLRQLLDKYPSSVREVIRIDPSLMTRADYLQSYPMLWSFLEQHPEVAHNPAYFVGEMRYNDDRNNPGSQGYRTIDRLGENFMVLFIVMTITAGLVWLVRTLVEQLRWQRAWREQSMLNTKLIDRFSSSDELLAYLQSPAGRGLTDMPTLPQGSTGHGMTAPLGRIFWSMQAGTVLAAAGLGLLFIGNRAELDAEIQNVFFALGIFVLTVGAGFVVSSGISYFLSHRLGLIQPLTSRLNSETPGS